MLITFTEAAKLAGVGKGAVRKAALEARKIKADKDEKGVWRIDAADVQRLWPQRPPLDSVSGHQQSPVSVGESHQDAGVIRELRARLDAAERRIADKDGVIDDLRRRLDAEAEERRKLTALLTDQRTEKPPQKAVEGRLARAWAILRGKA